jgi:hypothetical protein
MASLFERAFFISFSENVVYYDNFLPSIFFRKSSPISSKFSSLFLSKKGIPKNMELKPTEPIIAESQA